MAGLLILSDKLQMELEKQTDLLYLAPINLMRWKYFVVWACCVHWPVNAHEDAVL